MGIPGKEALLGLALVGVLEFDHIKSFFEAIVGEIPQVTLPQSLEEVRPYAWYAAMGLMALGAIRFGVRVYNVARYEPVMDPNSPDLLIGFRARW